MQLDVRVPSDNGDPLLSIWTLWWNAQQVPFSPAWWNGPIFYPAPDTLAFSDHRVGFGLIATPLIWSGLSPLLAYNITFLASYALSGAAMYALAYSLTRRSDAAFLGGLAFAFHPFRADHLSHLELLSSYWLPIALLALHQWVKTTRGVWLIVVTVALVMQALTCGYYFVFASVLIGFWLVWFVPVRLPATSYALLLAALAAPVLIVSPVLWHYHVTHEALGLSRSIVEIEQLSADIAGFLTAPERLGFWGWMRPWPSPEGALFPGLVLPLVVIAAAWWAWRERRRALDVTAAWPRWRVLCAGLGVAALLIASIPAISGPVTLDLGLARISISQAYKPMSVAALLLLVAGLGSVSLQAAWRRRSLLAFYAGATIVMWVCALGPIARFMGQRVFYKAPYAWLMELPGFAAEFRSPARFAMLGALTLAVAAAVGGAQLSRTWSASRRGVIVLLLSVGVLADGLVWPYPLVTPPPALEVPAAVPKDAVVVELPMGVFEDAAAMYHAITLNRPVANGLSGYYPPHIAVLHGALDDGHIEVLEALAPDVPLALFVDRASAAASWATELPVRTSARPIATTATHAVLVRPPVAQAPWTPPEPDRYAAIASAASTESPGDIGRVIDGQPLTAWATERAQQGGETVTVTLVEETRVSGVQLTLARITGMFPRALSISVSVDGERWDEVWSGTTARETLTAVLADPQLARVPLSFAPAQARFVRLVQTARANEAAWAIGELAILR